MKRQSAFNTLTL